MSGFRHDIAGGQGNLIIAALQSPDFEHDVSGWQIRKDGSAEFNDLEVRGIVEISGTNGMFAYAGTPGVGNLVASITADHVPPLITDDPFGNPIVTGMTEYNPLQQAVSFSFGILRYYSWNGAGWTQTASSGFSIIGTLGTQGGIFANPDGSLTVIPTGDVTGASDRANLNSALSLGIGLGAQNIVYLVSGTYFIDQPIVIPDQCGLIGFLPSWGIPTGNYGAGSLPLQGSVIKAGSAFAGTSLISMGSVGAVQHGGQRIYGITLSGTGSPAGTHGILSTGYVAGVKMRDVVVWGNANIADGLHVVNDGTPGHQADFWQVDSCKFSNCAGWGVLTVGLSDSWFTDTESTGNTSGGWNISGGADTRWTSCRADSNGAVPGWSLTPTGTGNFLEFVNCEANLNGTGWVFNGGSAASYFLTGCIAHGNTTAAYSYTAGAAVRSDGGNFSVWVPLIPQNGWANSGVGPAAQYCWRGSSVEVIADMTAGTLVAGTGVLALPGAAALAHAQTLPLLDETTRTVQAQINAGVGGTLSFFQGIGAVVAADRCFLHGFLSTDA